MGSSDSNNSSAVITTANRQHQTAATSQVRAPRGVQLVRVDGNNFLGRLADAPKFAGSPVRGKSVKQTTSSSFWRSSSSGRIQTSSSETCDTEEASGSPALERRRRFQQTPNLTDLLVRGFDPVEFERRAAAAASAAVTAAAARNHRPQQQQAALHRRRRIR